jgi:hypothetical protein
MTLFGWTLIRKSELAEYKSSHAVRGAVIRCHRWFSGWKDLDVIWSYLLSETYFGGIEYARKQYADARGTNEYGTPLKACSELPRRENQ